MEYFSSRVYSVSQGAFRKENFTYKANYSDIYPEYTGRGLGPGEFYFDAVRWRMTDIFFR